MSEDAVRVRVRMFVGLVLCIVLLLMGRLWFLQVVQGHEYAALADGNRIRVVPLPAPRGVIVDREGRILAGNRPAYTVSAVPGGLGAERDLLVERLAALLGMAEEEIEEVLRTARATYPYEPIRLLRDVGMEAMVALEEFRDNLPGVLIEEEWVREYRFAEVAGNTLGYLGAVSPADVRAGYRSTDLIGKAGLERWYEPYLRGVDGQVRVEVNALSRPIRVLETEEPVAGHDLHLTLDLELQMFAEEVLAEQLASVSGEFGQAGAGAAVVLDAKTGGLLAFVSLPTYDPNRLTGPERSAYFAELDQNPHSPFLHRAVRQFSPGSVFKVVTGAAALDVGSFAPDEIYNATGYHMYNKRDWSVRGTCRCPAGPVDIRMAMARSANDYFWEIALRPETGGIATLSQYARRFGLGESTGVDFPEMSGIVPDRDWKLARYGEPWYPAETMDVAIGQGFIEVTPLQMAQVYLAVANRGTAYRPHLLSRIVSATGEQVLKTQPESFVVPMRAENWSVLVESLRTVVQNPRGTAYQSLRAPGDRPWGAAATYDPAGKTGSAQLGPDQDTHAWFAGFAPAADPEIVVVVFAEYGGGGGGTAAPVARQIMDFYFTRAAEDAD